MANRFLLFCSMLVLQVKVKPRARASVLEQLPGGTWAAKLKSPPVDGKANEELIALVAKALGCPRSRLRIKSGAGAKMKLVEVLD
ncbi:MAG: DUF167 domain-containing protein [Brachymonas sp.]